MGLVPEEPGPPDEVAGQRELLSRLRAVVEAKDAENAVLRAELDAERELRRRLELRLAELERRLSMDSSDSGTPSSKERIGAKQARRVRQQSERDRRTDRKPGGQPGHEGKGLERDRDPDETKDAEPPAQCRRCRTALDGAQAAGSRWAQVIDVEVIRKATEWALPGLECPCCGAVVRQAQRFAPRWFLSAASSPTHSSRIRRSRPISNCGILDRPPCRQPSTTSMSVSRNCCTPARTSAKNPVTPSWWS